MTEEYRKQISKRLSKDFLDIQLLQLIKTKPIWGYKIKKTLKNHFDMDIRNSVLYPTLNLLEKKDFVTSQIEIQKGRHRKTYTLTAKGKEYLEVYYSVFEERQKKTKEII